ncbi:MAG: hypothetical protein JWO36_5524 [Myxococcales bacterium]|nr:hypothetical protein [Myxococcales bacterium]
MATTQDSTQTTPTPNESDAEAESENEAPRQTTAALKNKLQQFLEGARKRLEEVKQKIESLRDDDRAALQQQRDDSEKRMKVQRDREHELRANAESWQKERDTITDEQIAQWRESGEIDKLQSHADRAEEYALNAVIIAMMEADEVEQAVLEALSIRIDAGLAGS